MKRSKAFCQKLAGQITPDVPLVDAERTVVTEVEATRYYLRDTHPVTGPSYGRDNEPRSGVRHWTQEQVVEHHMRTYLAAMDRYLAKYASEFHQRMDRTIVGN
ncbi:MAG: hypothetical protein KKD18_00685 [Nanoarchaeota archaeon]|nr:hypothetical protein [Nanoarchaeota archaeon]MBU0976913.1 hypothetical protein [Nanoarchaeota archaeon]